jgi:nitroreductase
MFNDTSSTLALLRTRRSGRPRDLVEPGPDAAQLREILALATRVPDHGKLAPWRFIHVAKAQRGAFAELLERAYRAGKAEEPGRLEIEAAHRFAHQAPELVVALSSPVAETKIPLWEQELSCGAACMTLLLAAHATGFAGGWVTGWAAYSPQVLAGLGGRDGERIAGFLFLGTPGAPLEERLRPSLDEVIGEWDPDGAGAPAEKVAG